MNYNKIKEIISNYSERSKYFEKDFFPHISIKTKEGRFELLALSILDVRGFNADKLWYIVGKKLRLKNVLSIPFLLQNNERSIAKMLKNAEYNRGKVYTLRFARLLKRLAAKMKEDYNGDVSKIFYKHKEHNKDTIDEILAELKTLPGIGLKIATMYFKFMVSTFKIWKWKNPASLIGIPMPNDIQIRKVFIRLGHKWTKNMEEQYSKFGFKVKLPFMDIDDVLWNVGRIFCSKSSPACHYCPLLNQCNYAKLRSRGQMEALKEINNYIN